VDEIKARLKLTQAIIEAIRQGLTLEDIKKIFRIKADAKRNVA